jgi:ribonuclease HII
MESVMNANEPKRASRTAPPLLERRFQTDIPYELSIDEAGRGCLFGRVYIACVVLPKDPALFCGKDIKDSKKFSSKKKLNEVAEYIKTHAFAWHIAYLEHTVIDKINILQSVMRGMHECIRETINNIQHSTNSTLSIGNFMGVIDGNYFTPYRTFDDSTQTIVEMPYATVEKGDGKYMAIAAASILAKDARDSYIKELCIDHPILNERYGLDSNMGYGTKHHLTGIKEYGITQWHRTSFGCCKTADLQSV